MVDEWKIEEQSINTKKTLRAKNDAGQWTGSFAPYGYIEDPDDMYHLIVDEEAAKRWLANGAQPTEVVGKIFKLAGIEK
jgi:ribosomal protein S16